jgi:Pyridine nucleotide-disulphide oxidoreductase
MDTEYQRREAFPASKLTGSIPLCTIDEGVDPTSIARIALVHLRHLDLNLLVDDALWRDLCAFTGSLRTIAGADRILTSWKELTATYRPHDFKIIPGVRVVKPSPTTQWIEARFSFEMNQNGLSMECEGIMRLVQDGLYEWKIWTLVTLLKGVDGWGDVDNLDPIEESPKQDNLLSSKPDEVKHFSCVIVGSGYSGLCLAGRLKALGVSYIVIDKVENVGDVWANRYQSVRIHTSKEHGQFPFKTRIWGSETPYHLSPPDLLVGYQKFIDLYGINIQLSTALDMSVWNKKTRNWELQISQKGKSTTVTCQNLVLAIGTVSSTPKYPPNLVGRERFKGTILHSAEYSTSTQWKGLKGAVIGSANSAHDICNDMVKADLTSVTMVQRSRTPVLPIQFYKNIYDAVYNENSNLALSDQLSMSMPNAIGRLMAMKAISNMASKTPDHFEALEKVGFRVEPNMDLYSCLYERFGGHYFDVGVSKMIMTGEIKVKPAPPSAALCGFYEDGLEFEDGSRLETDVVVFATGFEGNMRYAAEKLVEPEVAKRLEDWWGVDTEGEIRGAWKPMGRMFSLTNETDYI